MASSLNASTAGGGGVIVTSDATGNLDIQSGGSTVVAVSSTGATFTGTGKFATTIGVGNATPAASGSGITFPATQSASSDANTLDDYEEGTWTPVPTALVGAFTTVGAVSGIYTKIGRQVTVQSSIVITNKGTASVGMHVSGLPFQIRNEVYAGGGFNGSNAVSLTIIPTGANTLFDVYKYDGTDPVGNSQQLNCTFTYFT